MKHKNYHCKKRFKEHYNYNISSEEIYNMQYDIQNNKSDFIRRKSLTITDWLINSKCCVARYSSSRHRIVTFLPLKKYKLSELPQVIERLTIGL